MGGNSHVELNAHYDRVSSDGERHEKGDGIMVKME